ncbi:MAG: isoprenylcysteine carboxylmethyltransferase family protein, partial [Clostridiales bacterium]|nr:isoprenylcysteine carboxylmethyltransferase family protein [Clostridiales bacterium]
IIGTILFLCAGSLNYINGWVFMLALFIPVSALGAVLLAKNPAVLERRLTSKEPDKSQRANISMSAAMFIAAFLISGLDYRFGWSAMPFGVTVAALAIMLAGYGMFAAVIMQNAYASRVVDVFEGQKIITSGLYSIVRHPMYTATLLIYLSMPLVLGSWFGWLPMIIYPFIIARRIRNEEALLVKELEGYAGYREKTRYRVVPLIW